MNPSIVAKTLTINGVVQGVGFRPFLFILARKHRLTGRVLNTPQGVETTIEGRLENIENFISKIHENPPLLASIQSIDIKEAIVNNYRSFQILKSQADKSATTLISPDVSPCKDCLQEMNDPNDRRFQYPFINCTHCGPRYTIIEDVPYDRPKTSMKNFPMCPVCLKEYQDPLDRRFHAQPNACPDCGPKVFLLDNNEKLVANEPAQALNLAGEYLKKGHIIGVKGVGGFHLACDAKNETAVKTLRKRKDRLDKPFALMAKNTEAVSHHVHINDTEKSLLTSYHRPIVLLEKKTGTTPKTKADSWIAPQVAPKNTCLGIMLPSTPLHQLLLDAGPDILVMTSGNRSKEPISITNEDAIEAFSHIADFFLLHDRDIYFGADDSLVRVQEGKTRFIRRSRGYAPLPIPSPKKMPKILACGAGLKNTVCLARDHTLFLSPHIGDLENIKTFEYFKSTIHRMKKIADVEPDIIAHDLHPGYMSSQYAIEHTAKTHVPVQHHHAHAAACMIENNLDEPVLAITLDGTGFGTDGHIWGGEILLATPSRFERKARLAYLPLPGGDAAALEPWRMAAAVLHKIYGKIPTLNLPWHQEMDEQKLAFISKMMDNKINTPLTSSAGRLFDALSSLLCICHFISYESQAAMELEAIAHENPTTDVYSYDITSINDPDGSLYRIDLMPAFSNIISDITEKNIASHISAKFHNTLVHAFAMATKKTADETGIKKVVLSGGVFNNNKIFSNMIQTLNTFNLDVFTHEHVPCGDGGICIGQAYVAAALQKDLA